MADLDQLTYGMVMDMYIEKQNDEFEYPYKATQKDIDKLIGG